MNKEEIHEFGDFEIAKEALESIIGQAALKVEGVHDLGGGFFENIFQKFSKNIKRKAIETEVKDSMVKINLGIIVEYGLVLEEVAERVKEEVGKVVKKMLGLEVGRISVNVIDVYIMNKD